MSVPGTAVPERADQAGHRQGMGDSDGVGQPETDRSGFGRRRGRFGEKIGIAAGGILGPHRDLFELFRGRPDQITRPVP